MLSPRVGSRNKNTDAFFFYTLTFAFCEKRRLVYNSLFALQPSRYSLTQISHSELLHPLYSEIIGLRLPATSKSDSRYLFRGPVR